MHEKIVFIIVGAVIALGLGYLAYELYDEPDYELIPINIIEEPFNQGDVVT
jgi:hypothetical protein